PTRGHIAISPHGDLYAMPSLCGSAGATRERFRAFAAHSLLACAALTTRYSPPSRPAHHRRHQLLDRGRAHLLHRGGGFRAQKLEHPLDAAWAEGAEAPDIGPPDADGVGADAQRLDDVGAAAEAAVDDDRDAPVHRLDDFRQRVDGRAPGILAARAVVGHDD